jgi:uncharacterized protein (TIGR02147 family)
MPNLFQYDDYRAFLKDYYAEMKKQRPAFSYKYLAGKSGFANKGFLFNIIHGKKSLSKHHIFRIAESLKLNKRETEYFENLVAFNQAETPEEQHHYYERLVNLKGDGESGVQVLRKEQYEFYARWWHATVRSLIDMKGFDGDFKRLSQQIRPGITIGQAKKSVALLLKLGLIRKDAKGQYQVPTKIISTGKSAPAPGLLKFHLETLDLAKAAIRTLPKNARNVSGLTLGISEGTYHTLCEEIGAFRKRVLQIAGADKNGDRVYQMNFHFFPMSVAEKEQRKKP